RRSGRRDQPAADPEHDVRHPGRRGPGAGHRGRAVSTGDLGPGYGTALHPHPDRLPNGHDGPAGPVALRSLPRRRRPVMIFLAVALVGAGIVASAPRYQRANPQVPVLVITAPVAAGEKITSSAVGTSSIAAGPGVTSI